MGIDVASPFWGMPLVAFWKRPFHIFNQRVYWSWAVDIKLICELSITSCGLKKDFEPDLKRVTIVYPKRTIPLIVRFSVDPKRLMSN